MVLMLKHYNQKQKEIKMAEQLTMAERLAQAAAGANSADNISISGNTIPVVESISSSTESGKSKSGTE